MNKIVAAFAGLLEPADREWVCGDVEELQLSVPTAVVNILGLVIRRQLAEWSHWRPWMALFGVAGIAGSYLSGSLAQLQIGIWVQIRTYFKYGVAYEPGGVSAGQEIAYTAALMIAMLLWSWACGAALALLSGRVFWLTASSFYFVVRDSWAVRMALAGNIVLKHGLGTTMLLRLLPLEPVLILFLLALALGVRSARKSPLNRNARLPVAAVGLTLVVLLVWMKNWFVAGFAHWSGQPYVPTPFAYQLLPLLAGAWPVFIIPLLHGSFLRSATQGRLT